MTHARPRSAALCATAALALVLLVPAALADHHAPHAAALLDRADQLFRAQDWEAAQTAYAQLVAENPYNGIFRYRLAGTHYYLGEYEAAAQAYADAAELGQSKAHALYNKACNEALLGNTEAAVTSLEAAIAAGIKPRERLIREDGDLDGIRDSEAFRTRILPAVPPGMSRAEGWAIDLAYLTRRVDVTHYGPVAERQSRDLDERVADILASVPGRADHEIIVSIMQLVTLLDDGHSTVRLPFDGPRAWTTLPFRFYEMQGELYVRAASPDYASAVGQRVVSIAGTPIDDALALTRTITARDNAMQLRSEAPGHLRRPQALHGLGLIDAVDAPIELVLRDDAGVESTVRPQPVDMATYQRTVRGPAAVSMESRAPHTPLWLRDPRDPYWFEVLDDGLLYFQYNAVRNRSEDDTIERFAAELFAAVERPEVEAMVIDVRLNGGGDNFLNRPLLHGIIRSDKLMRPGNLFLFTGRATFSACQNFINRVDEHADPLFVGEPSASRPNFIGEGNIIQLPWSGLLVNASSRLWQDSVSEDARVWIPPDLIAELTPADLLNGRDPALAAVRALRAHRAQARPRLGRRRALTAPALYSAAWWIARVQPPLCGDERSSCWSPWRPVSGDCAPRSSATGNRPVTSCRCAASPSRRSSCACGVRRPPRSTRWRAPWLPTRTATSRARRACWARYTPDAASTIYAASIWALRSSRLGLHAEARDVLAPVELAILPAEWRREAAWVPLRITAGGGRSTACPGARCRPSRRHRARHDARRALTPLGSGWRQGAPLSW